MTTEQTPGFEPKRMVALFYVAAAIFLGIFLEKVLGIVFSYARWNDFPVLGEDWTLTTVIGYAVAVGAAVVTWRTPRAREVSFEIAAELNRVTWPTLRETRAATVAVVVTAFVSAILLGVFDFVWARLSQLIY